MFPVFIIGISITVVVLIRLIAGRLNHARIRDYIASRGGEVISIAWEPFGVGWFGEKDSVIYSVRFRDRDGCVHEAQCKTSMLSGVYFTNESVFISSSDRSMAMKEDDRRDETVWNDPRTEAMTLDENRRLREENRRLREEVERLRGYRK